jgi:hypothetical protein
MLDGMGNKVLTIQTSQGHRSYAPVPITRTALTATMFCTSLIDCLSTPQAFCILSGTYCLQHCTYISTTCSNLDDDLALCFRVH